MIWKRDRVGTVPALGGLALALVVLATMIGGVRAQQNTVSNCDRCKNNAWARALYGECASVPGQWKMACLNNAVNRDCYDTGYCPDDEIPSTVSCAGMLGSGKCENGAQGICTNLTWMVYCEANTSKKCQDTQVPPMGTATPCHVSCICRE
jgi:hypothetical protein